MTSLYLMINIGHTERFHNKGSKGMGGAFDPPTQVTINICIKLFCLSGGVAWE